MTGAQIERERAKEKRKRGNALSDMEVEELEDLLSTLTVDRKQIREAMGFALDFADLASEVPQYICN